LQDVSPKNQVRAAQELIEKLEKRTSQSINIPPSGHPFNQIAKRGGTEQSIRNTVANPFARRQAFYRTTGKSATVYFHKDGSYVVVDDIIKEMVQISDRTNIGGWIPEPSIINPYVP